MTNKILELIKTERIRQDGKWGADSDNKPFEWISILGEEFGKLCEATNETCFLNGIHKEKGGYENILKYAVRVSAVSVAFAESIRRKIDRQKELPSIDDIIGIDPDFTGDMKSEDYIRKMRGEIKQEEDATK